MKIFNTKLYVLEEMTQEDLNNLALERNTLAEENKTLKQQLDYLRSGEYYNQLRFENEMLQNVVDTNGIPSEVYDYIECTHRNTELLEENQKLKNNWAKLKKWLKLHINTTTKDKTRILFKSILANVKEIEKSDNNG